jgi:hypothetical protein
LTPVAFDKEVLQHPSERVTATIVAAQRKARKQHSGGAQTKAAVWSTASNGGGAKGIHDTTMVSHLPHVLQRHQEAALRHGNNATLPLSSEYAIYGDL